MLKLQEKLVVVAVQKPGEPIDQMAGALRLPVTLIEPEIEIVVICLLETLDSETGYATYVVGVATEVD